MRSLLNLLILTVMIVGVWATPVSPVLAGNLDNIADHVFGQPDFTSNARNNGGIGPTSLDHPVTITLDKQGNLYVADYVNFRVLEYDAPLTSGEAASRVLGQPDFTSNTANNGGISAKTLDGPTGVALDAQGNLYVADNLNNRVLEYDNPLTNDTTADRVFGQPDFTSRSPNNGGVSANTLSDPLAVITDSQGNLYVSDSNNNRVLEYNTPLTADTTADHVYGQPNDTSNLPNNDGVTAASLDAPSGLVVDLQGNLYSADSRNHRILGYDTPLITDTTADRVFGQPDFTSNSPNNGGISSKSLNLPDGLALDALGNLYVADTDNSRILEYDTVFTADNNADHVFGQPSFTTNAINIGGLSASSLDRPLDLALDAQGNLYVADTYNNRVLEYDLPIAVFTNFLPVIQR